MSRDGHSVLVHGSEGTDTTLLVSSLARLILDPSSRTLPGFLALLEREWVQVRFMFHCRPTAGYHIFPMSAFISQNDLPFFLCVMMPLLCVGVGLLVFVFVYVCVCVQAGHPFQQRCAHSAYSHARIRQEAPVFLLLLDCVWQLAHQFPLAMGFSEALLIRLASDAYASNYGTFLCNSDQER